MLTSSRRACSRSSEMLYYIWISFLSAFLLFQIQPIIAKYLLPWFGGSTAVWSTTLLFFQVVLLGGYAYAYWLASSLNLSRQALLHMCLMGISFALLAGGWFASRSATLPIISQLSASEIPVQNLLKTLLLSVGVQYFVLAATSPIIQSWCCITNPTQSPYKLYAYSNAGSLIALISYPVLIEPTLSLRSQATLWSLGFIAFLATMGVSAVRVARHCRNIFEAHPGTTARDVIAALPPPSLGTRALWLALPGCASLLLLATTRQISQELAVVPFLWILPLTLYLLSFVLCFSHERWYPRSFYIVGLGIASGFLCWIMLYGYRLSTTVQIAGYCLVFFVCCMVCHGELIRLKPVPHYLTSFYLMISAGGALGGIFVALIAPHIFAGYWELQLGILCCWVLLLVVTASQKPHAGTHPGSFLKIAYLAGGAALLSLYFLVYIQGQARDSRATFRNFYGVLRVLEVNADQSHQRANVLYHGATIHGFQYKEEVRSREATAYYTPASGIGLAILHHPRRPYGLRIGVVGLGVGTLAAYGRPTDSYRMYEINPDVIRLAEGAGGFFTYLKNSTARIEVIPGDARLSMTHELNTSDPPRFDLLAIDAFNSDSIPVHLLTKEAFQIYLRHLQPDGILAVHITNKHLDLRPVISALAKQSRLQTVQISTRRNQDSEYPSLWILATLNQHFLVDPAICQNAMAGTDPIREIHLWSDDYSNLFQILK